MTKDILIFTLILFILVGCINNEPTEPIFRAEQIPYLLHQDETKSWQLVSIETDSGTIDLAECSPQVIYRFKSSGNVDSLFIDDYRLNCEDSSTINFAGTLEVSETLNEEGDVVRSEQPLVKFYFNGDSIINTLTYFTPEELIIRSVYKESDYYFEAAQ